MKLPVSIWSSRAGRAKSRGFTLIELMMAVVILSILVAIAIPSYSSYIQKSRRTEARAALLNLATLEERFFSTQNAYSSTTTDLGYGGAWPVIVGSGYYQVNAPVITAAGIGAPATYTIQAVPIGSQAVDTACNLFQVTSTGVQTALDSGGVDNTVLCWH
jgi:type IV pilus assembly protein PilE